MHGWMLDLLLSNLTNRIEVLLGSVFVSEMIFRGSPLFDGEAGLP